MGRPGNDATRSRGGDRDRVDDDEPSARAL
jgi:hypothetical protein